MAFENEPLVNQGEDAVSKPKTSRTMWLVLGGCGIIVVVGLVCVALWFFVIRGMGGEPANAATAEKVTRELVQALYDGDVESAHGMFVEEFRTEQTPADLASVFLKTEYIKEYKDLDVCEFGLIGTPAGRMLVAKGLLHYGGGDVVFESSLRKDADNEWRVYGFYLQPELTPTPWGACQYD